MGALLTVALPIGLLGTVVGVMRAFGTLASSSSGIGDPQAISESLGATLVSAFLGLALFLVSLVILLLSLVFFFRLRSTPPPLPPPPSQ